MKYTDFTSCCLNCWFSRFDTIIQSHFCLKDGKYISNVLEKCKDWKED